MKKLLLVFTCLSFITKAQLPNYNFAINAGGISGEQVYPATVTHDNSGNVYVAGSFNGTIDLDPTPGVYNVTSQGWYDMYLAKYNAAGQLLWGFSTGAVGDDGIYRVITDASGNVYISGYFQCTLDMDPAIGSAFITSIDSTYDAFVAKYNSSGQFQMAFSVGSDAVDWSQNMCLDASGNIFITGIYEDTLDLDPSASTYSIVSNGFSDAFVAKYNSSGMLQWGFGLGSGAGNETGYGIACDQSGNVIVTGDVENTTDFDPSIATATLQPNGHDVFIAKYNSTGNYQWAFNMGSGGIDKGQSVSCDPLGNIYVTGNFEGAINLNPGGSAIFLASSTTDVDAFIAKYDPAGSYLWGFNLGGNLNENGACLTVDAASNVYLTGSFQNTADFDPGTGTINLTAATPSVTDVYIAKYNSTGNYQWAFNTLCNGGGNGVGIDVDGSGNVYVTGNFTGNSDFDPSLVTHNLSSVGSSDMFLAKYSPLCTTVSFTFTTVMCTCPNASDGSATVNVSGGTSPYTFQWDLAAGSQTTQTASNLIAGNYEVLVTDANGCPFSGNVNVLSPAIPVPTICMVTVDSTGTNNLILWDKTQYMKADSFYVYRDIANNNFQLIGKVPVSALYGEFVDTVRTKYPANGDPKASSWKYKISIKDSCGTESAKSLFHKSLFIQNSSGNFTWNDYQVEGQPIPVPTLNNYIFRRDNLANGNWNNIQTLSASSIAYTDPNYLTYSATADWRIETLWNVTCGSSYLKTTGSVKRSKSNLSNNRLIGIKELQMGYMIKVYPNPASDEIYVDAGILNENFEVILENSVGQSIYQSNTNKNSAVIDVKNFAKGFYNLRIQTQSGSLNKKVVID
jgi:hypothetical protein